ncbi:MAG: cysteine desulfurase [Gemmatimonadaceae bacterium]|nr:cysteine desulfurase [Gemmatimonadaceae bacterium]NUR19660.1 cysteine desulfurase [Gemmatimonadaceae bacterium]NUS96006.1 cysteine desulfurase [Gemmatimonadaceae bacterium]
MPQTASDFIYLDHAATTPVRQEVLDAMLPFLGNRFGNPSSMHRWGRDARVALDEARERVAGALGARVDEICFTSGGTEADNLAILGAWHRRRAERPAVVTSPIEHKAVLATAHQVAREGGEERIACVTPDGVVDVADAERLIDEKVAVVSIMWVNNEIGTVQDVPRIGAAARARGALMHTDAVQAFGKVALDLSTLPVDLLSISGHKIGAPKGIGAMFVRRGVQIEPLFHGGAQDRGRRPGTENVAFAVALATAAELAVRDREKEQARLRALRDELENAILAAVPDAIVHGLKAPRVGHITSVSVPGIDAESLLMALDLEGIGASAGSACQSGSVSPSHVLAAMGVRPEIATAAVRMSLGSLSSEEAIRHVAERFPALVRRARDFSGLAAESAALAQV